MVAIGAYFNGGNGDFSGHVRVYGYNGTNWLQLGDEIDGEAAGDWSGRSVSLSADGRTVAIGAYNNDGNGSNSGHVRVYGYNDGTNWTQLGDDIDGEAAGDGFGVSVSLSADGRTVASGAFWNDGNGHNSGHVRIYSLDDCNETAFPTAPRPPPTSDRLSTGAVVGIAIGAAAICVGAGFGALLKWRKANREDGRWREHSSPQPVVGSLQPNQAFQTGQNQLPATEDSLSPTYKHQGRTVPSESQEPAFAEAVLAVDENR